MTILTIIRFALSAIGLAEQFDAWIEKREAAKKAQAIANAPTTNQEWTDAGNAGDL